LLYKVYENSQHSNYDYDKVGNLVRTQFANGSVESRQYDERDRLKQVTTQNVVGTVFSDFIYTLDSAGNRTKVVEHSGRTVNYAYDKLHRLTQESITDGVLGNRSIAYTYDNVGNRLTRNDSLSGLINYTYDRNDRLVEASLGGQTTLFSYNKNGSLIRQQQGTNITAYDWINDGENRLIGVTQTKPTGTTQTQYVYDAFGKRVGAIADGVRTNYLSAAIWDLPEVLLEYDDNQQITAKYTHGFGTIRSQQGGREVFHHTDGLGSTRALTDTVGLVTDRYSFDAFGELLNHTGTFGNSFQFAGEQRDSSTNLDYLRSRFYDPSLGRFISKDSFSGFANDPYSLHDYQYAHGNPVLFTDPTGYFTMGDVWATLKILMELSLVGSTSFAAGYILGGVMTGADADDVLQMVGDFGAGFANGISGGYLTDVYEYYTGNKIEPQHGALWNAGNIAGVSSVFLVGLKLPAFAATAVGPLRWVAVGATALDGGFGLYGAANATQNLYNSWQEDGKWEWNDAWNLLSYAPIAGFALGGVKKFIGGARAAGATGGARSADRTVRTMAKTETDVGSPLTPEQVPPAIRGGCFVAGTEILTTEGIKNIEDIQEGDWVIADDPTTPGEIQVRQVLTAYERDATTLIDIYVDGEVISTTEEHPIWAVDKGWVEPKDLNVGDRLQTEAGGVVDVDRLEKREGVFKVYNFRVEGIPTYFVSDLGILVHNNVNCFDNVPSRKQDGKFTEPTLPKKEIASGGDVKITHNYRSNDHAPAHVHVTGGGKETRIKENGQPMPGDPAPTSRQQRVIDENWPQVRQDLKKITKWLKYNNTPD
jgi:RHS repeat-associated protein